MLMTSYKELTPELKGVEPVYVGVIREGVNYAAPVVAMTLPTADIDQCLMDLDLLHDALALQANPALVQRPRGWTKRL